ncbi:MAG: hypothetical protein J7M26_08205, partial [Armatimonadetes bacterium]|nr:hypothetical protein [Armatimonadota bacterium]
MTALLLVSLLLTIPAQGGETVGKRPYEMDWAGRVKDDYPHLVEFEDLTGWTVKATDAQARFERSREQQLWDRYVGKLTYRGLGHHPEVLILPPQPIAIEQPFDAVTVWIYGNNWAWAPDRTTPQVTNHALFETPQGQQIDVYLTRVRWKEWFLVHRRLTPEQIKLVAHGARFVGFKILGGTNKADRVLYFDGFG